MRDEPEYLGDKPIRELQDKTRSSFLDILYSILGATCMLEIYSAGEEYYYNTVALVRKRTIPTERPPFVGEVSANFCG
jgi:hypothetical protein